jgi:hypothetical protein
MRRVVEEDSSPIKKAEVVLPFCRTTSDIYFHAYRHNAAANLLASLLEGGGPRSGGGSVLK